MTANTNAIQIDNVSKHYEDLYALDQVNFNIPQGSFFGLLGPNGAGKSTLINIMAGLTKSSLGNVRIMGHHVEKNWRESRYALGVVPQELVYDPFFTVREMLRLQSGYFGFGKENDAWIDELMESFSLSDKADTNLQRLSGGMKRRVLIAQALVHKPPVLLLDEPTAGVDIELRQSLWAFTKQLHAQGHTILLTTHYLEEAQSLCKQIAILNKGKLVALDDTQALVDRHPYRLLCLRLEQDDLSQLPAALRDKIVPQTEHDPYKLTLRLHREKDKISDVLMSLHNTGIEYEDLNTEDPGLEEVFLSLTQQANLATEKNP